MMPATSQVNPEEERLRGSVWLDAALIAAAVVCANAIFAPGDVGWRELQPSPYLLAPVLLGCRYGFVAGVCAGLGASVLILTGARVLDGTDVRQTLSDSGTFFAGMLLAGAICGEMQSAFRKRERRLSARLQQAQARLKRLDADLFLTRESKAELERLVATRDSQLSTLDSEVRRLFESEGDDLYHGILMLLNRQARVTDGAIYLREKGELRRMGWIGSDRALPERTTPEEIEMFALALDRGTPVTLPEFWSEPSPDDQDYLAVVPLLDSTDRPFGLVAVTGIPFIALHRRTVQLIALICRWATRLIESRSADPDGGRTIPRVSHQRICDPEHFHRHLHLAHRSAIDHDLPSALVVFTLRGRSRSAQPALEYAVLSNMRCGDFAVDLPGDEPAVAVLLPLTGARGAQVFVERILLQSAKTEFSAALSSRMILVQEFADIDALWKTLGGKKTAYAAAA